MNAMSWGDMKKTGAYFVTSKTAFSMPYLELLYLRLQRGKLAPGQEAAVLQLYHKDSDVLPTGRRLRELLLHALESFAVSKRTPSVPVEFNINYPATYCTKMNDILLFEPDTGVDAISFDGHFGIHRPLCDLDPPRTVKAEGSSPHKEDPA